MVRQRFIFLCLQGQQLLYLRRLSHGVHKFVAGEVQRINAAFGIGIQHGLYTANQILERRFLTKVPHRRCDIAAHAGKEPC